MSVRVLAQNRENSTNPISIYRCPASKQVKIENIVITNTTDTSATFSIFLDKDGDTFDQGSAIAYDMTIYSNSTIEFTGPYYLDNSLSNLGYKTNPANAVTITVFGYEATQICNIVNADIIIKS